MDRAKNRSKEPNSVDSEIPMNMNIYALTRISAPFVELEKEDIVGVGSFTRFGIHSLSIQALGKTNFRKLQ